MDRKTANKIADRIEGNKRDNTYLLPHQHELIGSLITHTRIEVGDEIPGGGEKTGNHGTLKSATGTGKTVSAGTIVKDSEERAVIVTSRNLLSSQIHDDLIRIVGFPEKDIGIYDGQQKELAKENALKKPLLITTYPSFVRLASRGDISFQKKSKNFRPIIIPDEAHRVGRGGRTAECIRAFKENSLVYALTATDRFADGTNVSDELFDGQSNIYELGIRQAISASILARGARTGVMDIEVPEGWIKEFAALNGHEFKGSVLQHFAESPDVIREVVNLHGNYEDKVIGEISRFPTVVYTYGIRAANSMAAAFCREYGDDYAVAVSGKMSKKEQQRLVEAYKGGHHRVICNADLLVEGFDHKNTTVGLSVRLTRAPWIVEQQFGRLVRPQDWDYLTRYGGDKVALGINFRPKGVHTCIFGQVIGPELYAPGVRTPHKPKGPRKKGPGWCPVLPDGNELHTEYQDLVEIIAGTDKALDGLPDKTEEWLTREEFAKYFNIAPNHGTTSIQFNRLWKEIESTYAEKGSVLIDGHTVECGNRKFHNWASFCIHINEAEWLGEKAGLIEVKTEEWRSKTEYAKDLLGIRLDNEDFNNLWEQIETQYKKAPNDPVIIDEYTVSCGYKKAVAIQPFCVNISDLQWFKTKLGLTEEKTSSWKTKQEYSGLLGIASDHEGFNELWNKITECYDNRPNKPVIVYGHEVDCGNKRSRGVHFCVNESEENWFRQTLKLPSQSKTSEWKNKTEFSKLIKTHIANPRFDKLWREIESAYSKNNNAPPIIDGHLVKCAIVKSGPKLPFCLDENEADWFRRKMDTMATREKPKRPSTDPESDDIKSRTGRSRGEKK